MEQYTLPKSKAKRIMIRKPAEARLKMFTNFIREGTNCKYSTDFMPGTGSVFPKSRKRKRVKKKNRRDIPTLTFFNFAIFTSNHYPVNVQFTQILGANFHFIGKSNV